MKKIILFFLSICCYSQHEKINKGRVLNSDNEPVKNVYIINSQCEIISISNKKGYFTYSDDVEKFEFVKKGIMKTHFKKENNILTVYVKKSNIETLGKITNFLGVYPTRNIQVNGLAFNLMTDFEDGTEKSTLTNGVEIDIDPLSALFTFISYVYIGSKDLHNEPYHCLYDYKLIKQINGLNLNLFSLKPMITNGVYLGTSLNQKNITNGLSISLLTNQNSKINGISISVFGNHDISCNGIQIGLFNSSSNLKGIQIGLWNKNQKRSLPIINWNFKS